jgi:hypothetical protein
MYTMYGFVSDLITLRDTERIWSNKFEFRLRRVLNYFSSWSARECVNTYAAQMQDGSTTVMQF